MFKRMMLGLLLALATTAAQAQEAYLPAKSQFYFQWDGMKKHQAAYDKTAAGKMMQGDTGKFLDELWKYAQEQLLNVATDKQPKVVPFVKDLGKIISTMHGDGFALGLEAEAILPPSAQLILVFPKGAGDAGALLPLIQKVAEETKADVKNTKVGNRFVYHVDIQAAKIAWWAQGSDALIYVGTNDPVAYAKAIDAKKTGLAKNPLYQKIAKVKEFTTSSRGFFDMTGVLKVASDVSPEASKIVDELGLRGLKNITFASGYDGIHQRSIVDTDMPERAGLLAFTSQKKISLKDLPALPNDLTGFSAKSVGVNKTYDVLTGLLDSIVRIFDANKADDINDAMKAFQGAIGVDINADLFGNFGDLMVTYASPSEGILSTGGVTAIQIKDGKKLEKALDKLIKAIPGTPAGEVSLTKKDYRGAQIMYLELKGAQVNQTLVTFGIYKNWFVLAQYPQPIKGFVMRQEGKLPIWKADESLTKALTAFPKEFTAITISDPRPSVQSLLAAAPLVMSVINSVGTPLVPNFKRFDLDLIPHPQEATLNLFPNITISTDDGKRIRTESRGSLLFSHDRSVRDAEPSAPRRG